MLLAVALAAGMLSSSPSGRQRNWVAPLFRRSGFSSAASGCRGARGLPAPMSGGRWAVGHCQ
eukprot:14487930-Alexandrium_andersonii.AAC.1